ncbi:MAG: DUF3007 family protein [Alkalinema sp. RU_4_3]|nr:DUF3007 family protein [Alkalinema sp. RU_4_3]
MRRIDAILITLGVFGAGGLAYVLLKVAGLEEVQAGIWSQVALVVGLLGWVSTYVYRALNQKMSYVQQLKDYEEAVIQQRYEEMTPEQLAELQAEIDRDRPKNPEES